MPVGVQDFRHRQCRSGRQLIESDCSVTSIGAICAGAAFNGFHPMSLRRNLGFSLAQYSGNCSPRVGQASHFERSPMRLVVVKRFGVDLRANLPSGAAYAQVP